jgi:hypothetical protein
VGEDKNWQQEKESTVKEEEKRKDLYTADLAFSTAEIARTPLSIDHSDKLLPNDYIPQSVRN